MSRVQTRDAFKLESGVYQKSILMQLCKVCNHPDLSIRPIVTSFAMQAIGLQVRRFRDQGITYLMITE